MHRGDVAAANSLTDRIRQKITAHSRSLLSSVPRGSTEMWQMVRQVTGKQKRPIDKLVNVNVEDLFTCKIRAVRRLWTAVLFLCFSYGAMVWVYLGD